MAGNDDPFASKKIGTLKFVKDALHGRVIVLRKSRKRAIGCVNPNLQQ
jgi:hypothetical protein